MDSPVPDFATPFSPGLHTPEPKFTDETIQSLLSSLGLPPAGAVGYLTIPAAYHIMYLLRFDPEFKDRLKPAKLRRSDGCTCLVLRISGKHLPRIKTINEVAVMRWVRENTTIPVPEVVRWDASEDNVLDHEFILMEAAEGFNACKHWHKLDRAKKHFMVSQIADYLGQLHARPFELIGGMQCNPKDGSVIPGQIVDEKSWQAQDVAKYWPSESISTLNMSGPYESYTALCAAKIERVAYAIEKHDELAWIRDLVPRLQAFVGMLSNHPERVGNKRLNDAKIVLSHCGLHFGNILDPADVFLWNGEYCFDTLAEDQAERRDMMAEFRRICQERGNTVMEDVRPRGDQKAMQDIVDFMQRIVDVCPRGIKQNEVRQNEVRQWRTNVEDLLSEIGIPL